MNEDILEAADNRKSRQTSLSISFNDDEMLQEFERQIRPKSIKKKQEIFKPSIAFPYHKDTSINWDEILHNLLYPCYEGAILPVGPERNRHCESCKECQRKMKEMDAMFIPGNKWLEEDKNGNI